MERAVEKQFPWPEIHALLKSNVCLESNTIFREYFGSGNDPLPNMQEVDAEKFWHHFSIWGTGIAQGYRQIIYPTSKREYKAVHYFIYYGGEGYAISVDYNYNESPKWKPRFYSFYICDHERISTVDTRTGWHEGYCARCGLTMNYDSSG